MKNPREIPAGEFKAKCLGVLDRVQRTGEIMIVTKHGRPVAKIGPVDKRPYKSLKGSVTILGDIMSPVLGKWEMDR